MATIFRQPLYTRIAGRDYDRALHSQPWRGSSTALLIVPSAVIPQNETEWPNPQIPRQSVWNYSWLQNATFQLIATGTVMGIGWLDTPDFVKRIQFEHIRNVALLAPAGGSIPPFATNFPNPGFASLFAALHSFRHFNPLTQAPGAGTPLTAANSLNWHVNPFPPLFPAALHLSARGSSALSLTPPPVGGTARSSGLYIGIRIGI